MRIAVVLVALVSACKAPPSTPAELVDYTLSALEGCSTSDAKTADGTTYTRFCQYMISDADVSGFGALEVFSVGIGDNVKSLGLISNIEDAARVRDALAVKDALRLVPVEIAQ